MRLSGKLRRCARRGLLLLGFLIAAAPAALAQSHTPQGQSAPSELRYSADKQAPIYSAECLRRFRAPHVTNPDRMIAELCVNLDGMFAASGEPGQQACTMRSEQQVIDVAISRYVDSDGSAQASYDRGGCAGMGGPPCVNPFPYRSISEFKAKNPSCCRVLTVIPGELGKKHRPNIRGEKEPRMYLVEMELQAFEKADTNEPVPYRHKGLALIDCRGQLIH